MRRLAVATTVSLIMLVPYLWTEDASARAGRGGSSGSRGSRSYSVPVSHSSPAGSPASSAAPSATSPARVPPSIAGGSGVGGMIGGLVAGGLLGSLLFGGGGGFGFMDLAVLGFLGYLVLRRMRAAAAQPEPATPSSFAPAVPMRFSDGRGAPAPWSDVPTSVGAPRPEPPVDQAEVTRVATAVFLSVQSAWTSRDMGLASDVLTPEMRAQLQRDCDQTRAQGQINRIESITVREVETTETWQEPGRNFMTVRIEASLLDYTADETTGEIVEGSATEPVTFQEYWTFARAVWVKGWRLTAIQQPAATRA